MRPSSEPPLTNRRPATGGRAWIVAAAAMFICGWGGNQFTPLLSMYRAVNEYSATVVDALLGAYVIGLAPALLIGGPLSDRRGRRPLVLAGLGASGLGSAALAAGGLRSLPGAALGFLAAGRLLSGIAVGLGMAVGTAWLVELTVSGGRSPATGARRASLSLTAGFGLGAGVAGVLAQWSPGRESVPYLVHLLLCGIVIASVLRWGLDTRTRRDEGSIWSRFRVPALQTRRFRRLVLPMAPWVFGAAGVAYAIVPQALAHRMGHWYLLYATALTVATLGAGVLVQPIARRLDHPSRPRAMVAAMVAMTAGVSLAAAAVAADSPWLGAASAVALGSAYGVALIAGLLEIQRLTAPSERAALTGVYYALAYVGFLLPTALAVAGRWVSTSSELAIMVVVCLACTLVIGTTRSGPGDGGDAVEPAREATDLETTAARQSILSS